MQQKDAITFKQLRALSAIRSHKTITDAAEMLGLTPPAVHTQLKGLSSNLDANVIERDRSGAIRITDVGFRVLDAIDQIDSAIENCMQDVKALRDGFAGVVSLGVISTGKYFAPRLVAQLKREYPDISVVMKVGNREEMISALRNGSVQLAIMGRPPREPRVISESLGPHPHVVIASADHPLSRYGRVTPEQILEQPILTREEGSGTRILMVRYLDRIGDGKPYEAIELGSNETIKQAVIAGLGIALISQHTVSEELRSGRLVALRAQGLPIERHWHLIHRESMEMQGAVRTVHDFIAAQKGAFLPDL
ncbi:MAG: LysR substrate-binding domain-containing protein [Brevirhabdus sp.]